ncbi:carbohydrate ABC transporter permease [Nonomuraea sp. NPDC059194]|uniref:carbohydrate ABC transporter permease n=1 Tax=Nonomuraea sp. NPDC059194 TaxID=3346764 RepID=UPI0036C20B9E
MTTAPPRGAPTAGLTLLDVGIQIPFTTLPYMGFVKGLPREIDEAAVLDGAGPVRLFFRVILPLLRPVTTTNVVLLFTFARKEFQNVLFLMPDSSTWTMPMRVFDFQSLHAYNYALVCANLIIAVVPVLILCLSAQRYIVKGVIAGSVK